MAEILLSGDELVCILKANRLIPDEVTDIVTEDGEIRIRIRTPWPIVKSIHVGMRFAGFEQGRAVLRVQTNRVLDRFDWLVDKMIAGFPLQEYAAQWIYPRLYVDVNELLHRQIRGVQVTDIMFQDGQFRITTDHSFDATAPRNPEGNRGTDSSSASSDSVV